MSCDCAGSCKFSNPISSCCFYWTPIPNSKFSDGQEYLYNFHPKCTCGKSMPVTLNNAFLFLVFATNIAAARAFPESAWLQFSFVRVSESYF